MRSLEPPTPSQGGVVSRARVRGRRRCVFCPHKDTRWSGCTVNGQPKTASASVPFQCETRNPRDCKCSIVLGTPHKSYSAHRQELHRFGRLFDVAVCERTRSKDAFIVETQTPSRLASLLHFPTRRTVRQPPTSTRHCVVEMAETTFGRINNRKITSGVHARGNERRVDAGSNVAAQSALGARDCLL